MGGAHDEARLTQAGLQQAASAPQSGGQASGALSALEQHLGVLAPEAERIVEALPDAAVAATSTAGLGLRWWWAQAQAGLAQGGLQPGNLLTGLVEGGKNRLGFRADRHGREAGGRTDEGRDQNTAWGEGSSASFGEPDRHSGFRDLLPLLGGACAVHIVANCKMLAVWAP